MIWLQWISSRVKIYLLTYLAIYRYIVVLLISYTEDPYAEINENDERYMEGKCNCARWRTYLNVSQPSWVTLQCLPLLSYDTECSFLVFGGRNTIVVPSVFTLTHLKTLLDNVEKLYIKLFKSGLCCISTNYIRLCRSLKTGFFIIEHTSDDI